MILTPNKVLAQDTLLAQREDNKESTVVDEDNVGFIFPFNIEIAKDVKELKKQVGLINADVTGIEARISKIEMDIKAQAGMINRISSNSGTQIFSGEVSVVAIAGLGVVLIAIVWGGYYYKRSIEYKKGKDK